MHQPRVSRDLCTRIARHLRTRPHAYNYPRRPPPRPPIRAPRTNLASILLDFTRSVQNGSKCLLN